MKTAVTHTSLEAYFDEKRIGRAGTQRRRIFEFIQAVKVTTRQEIEHFLGLKINVVCGRVRELIDARAIEVRGSTNIGITGSKEMRTTARRELLSVCQPEPEQAEEESA